MDDSPDASSAPAAPLLGAPFEQAARVVLGYLRAQVPLGFWAVTRVENGRQTYLVLDDNAYGLVPGGSHSWESSYCVHMAAGRGPSVAPDAQAVPVYAAAAVNAHVQIGAYAGVALHEPDGSLFGAICGVDPDPQAGDSALAGAEPLLVAFGQLLTVVLAGERAREQAAYQALVATEAAQRDALTGLLNRRAWDQVLAEEEVRFAALGDPTVLVVVDLDEMKTVNDEAGHAAGDDHLRRAAQALTGAVRSSDVVARVGGDEFAVLLRGCPQAYAAARVAAMSAALTAAGVPGSLGWAALRVGQGVPAALAAADAAMYAVKRERRVVRLTDALPSPRAQAGAPSRRA